ncbi:thiamine pyrophosphate-dependent enzyme, partial [Sediminibacterium sp.]|uniref:thiamine pyrophosphate-dependent dehydrogenase E1 component subunit alpha n=1 Tax=Sediminibacterium sp. TaxID=1917865 RepID=UPI003F69E4A9
MESTASLQYKDDMLSFEGFRQTVLEDYRTALISREVSLLGRREVLTGKAKFGIFGDGKEVPQLAMAKFFQPGDFRSGYYRDQTFMFAAGLASVEQYFAQLYADPDVKNDPFSAGRQMNAHFATKLVDENGNWLDLANRKNVSADMAPTASQMPRGLGLAFASKCFRQNAHLREMDQLSHNGNEVCFTTIGDASTSEGHFWETMNAAAVLQVPLAVFVWDDGYGISVPKNFQTTKGSISEALRGLEKMEDSNGIRIYKLKAWDYAGLCQAFEEGIQRIRDTHVPVLFHVEEVTQPQGHSTSGSHERYKTPERLAWEKEWDCIKKMKEWMLANNLSNESELSDIEAQAKDHVRESRQRAWDKYINPIKEQAANAGTLLKEMMVSDMDKYNRLQQMANELLQSKEPLRRDVLRTLSLAIELAPESPSIQDVQLYYQELLNLNKGLYNTHLYNQTIKSALKVPEIKPLISFDAPTVNGFEVLNKYFDALFTQNPKVYAFGEDVGYIGDVNQGFAGLQEKHGRDRIFDTGIRELTIMGQAVGMALRGLRPIAEIQYLDYLLYGLQILSDDVATTHFRTKGQQCCP